LCLRDFPQMTRLDLASIIRRGGTEQTTSLGLEQRRRLRWQQLQGDERDRAKPSNNGRGQSSDRCGVIITHERQTERKHGINRKRGEDSDREPFLKPTLDHLRRDGREGSSRRHVIDYRLLDNSEWLSWKKDVIDHRERGVTMNALINCQQLATAQALVRGGYSGPTQAIDLNSHVQHLSSFDWVVTPREMMPGAQMPPIPEFAKRFPCRNHVSLVEGDILDIVADEALQIGANEPPVALITELVEFTLDGDIATASVESEQQIQFIRTDLLKQITDVQSTLSRSNGSAYLTSTTTLHSALFSTMPAHGLFFEKVTHFRGRADEGYPFVDQPTSFSVVAVGVESKPVIAQKAKQVYDSVKVRSSFVSYESQEDERAIEERMELILNTCYERGIKRIVMPLLGSTAGHPAKGTAFLIREYLWKHASHFEEIILVLPPAHRAQCSEILFPSANSKVASETLATEKLDHEKKKSNRPEERKIQAMQQQLLASTKLTLGRRLAGIEEDAKDMVDQALNERRAILKDGVASAEKRDRRGGIHMFETEAPAFSEFLMRQSLPPVRNDAFGLEMLAKEMDELASEASTRAPSRLTDSRCASRLSDRLGTDSRSTSRADSRMGRSPDLYARGHTPRPDQESRPFQSPSPSPPQPVTAAVPDRYGSGGYGSGGGDRPADKPSRPFSAPIKHDGIRDAIVTGARQSSGQILGPTKQTVRRTMKFECFDDGYKAIVEAISKSGEVPREAKRFTISKQPVGLSQDRDVSPMEHGHPLFSSNVKATPIMPQTPKSKGSKSRPQAYAEKISPFSSAKERKNIIEDQKRHSRSLFGDSNPRRSLRGGVIT